jgi:alkanesulfonate monooxygenase SsuD/methylene tetrahydromethanopterin reductase-like flavin-dependent oxidoreductase (luciferase family)
MAAMSAPFEIGLDTFGDRPLRSDGTRASHAAALRDVVEQAVLADEVGLDFIGLGEHHRDDFSISAPEVVLAAIASRTRRIKLGSAVTIPTAPVGVHAPGHVAETDEAARAQVWPHFLEQRTRIGGERGWPPPTCAQFEAECGPDGALFVGSPETVAKKIVATARTLRLDRFDLKYANGAMSHEQLLRTIELVGTQVAPFVRDALAR